MQIELDITYRCNLNCVNCNRVCGLAPRDDMMSLSQVERFREETLTAGVRWDQVAVLGGEPTLHPDVRPILGTVLGLAKRVLFVTNGLTGVRSPEDLGFPADAFKLKNTAKKNRVHRFAVMTDAVVDFHPDIPDSQYAAGCEIPRVCGLGLNASGYYPCPIAGTVDRIFDMGLAAGSLRELLDSDPAQVFVSCCRYCGHFWDTLGRPWDIHEQPTISVSWEDALRRFNDLKDSIQ